MRNGDAPSGLAEVGRQRACVMAVRAALEAVQQHDDFSRVGAAGEIHVDEIAVGALPALARESDARRREKRRGDGLQMADQCRSFGAPSRGALCGCPGAGEA